MRLVRDLNSGLPIIPNELIRFYSSVILFPDAGDPALLVPSNAQISFYFPVASQNFIEILVISCEHTETIILVNCIVKNQGVSCDNFDSW